MKPNNTHKIGKTRAKMEILLLVLISFAASMCGCTKEKKENVVYGGEMIKYGICFSSSDDFQQSFAIPFIASNKIEKFEFNSLDVTGSGDYSVSCSDLYYEQAYKYKGWNVYWCVLELGLNDYKNAADFTVDALNVMINGKKMKYKTPYFHIRNTKGYNDKIVYDGTDNLLFSGDTDLIYPKIPDDESNPVHSGVTISKSVNICDYLASDFLDVKNLKVTVNEDNGKKIQDYSIDEISTKNISRNSEVTFTYNLNYQEGVKAYDVVKTTKIILYKNKKNQLCMFSDNTGFFINNSDNEANVKEYIETLPKH